MFKNQLNRFVYTVSRLFALHIKVREICGSPSLLFMIGINETKYWWKSCIKTKITRASLSNLYKTILYWFWPRVDTDNSIWFSPYTFLWVFPLHFIMLFSPPLYNDFSSGAIPARPPPPHPHCCNQCCGSKSVSFKTSGSVYFQWNGSGLQKS